MIDSKSVASLARIELKAGEEEELNTHFASILKYFEELEKVDTKGVEPMVTPTDIVQNLREDTALTWENIDQALDQAPEKSGQLFKVPPVM